MKNVIEPLQLEQDSVITYMRNFMNQTQYEVLMGLWRMERAEILREGMRLKTPDSWAKLEGFERAVGTISKWAAKKLKKDQDQNQTEDE